VDGDIRRRRGAACRERFKDQRRIEAAEAGAAHILARVNAGKTELCRLFDNVDGEMLLLVPLGGMRRQFIGGETLRHFLNGVLFVG